MTEPTCFVCGIFVLSCLNCIASQYSGESWFFTSIVLFLACLMSIVPAHSMIGNGLYIIHVACMSSNKNVCISIVQNK